MRSSSGDIRRRRIPADKVRERVKFLRQWQRGFDPVDGIDLRKPLSKAQRRRVHRAYRKLREITPGVDSQQRWTVKEVRSERASRLMQEFAGHPHRIKGLKRVPVTSSPLRELRAAGEPVYSIDYRARGGKGAVRVHIGKARVDTLIFDKKKLLSGDADYLDEIARKFPVNGLGTLLMGGLEQVQMPWATDGNVLVQNILEVLSNYAPSRNDTRAILRGEIKAEDAKNFRDEFGAIKSPWVQWLDGARFYFMSDGSALQNGHRRKGRAPWKRKKKKRKSRRL